MDVYFCGSIRGGRSDAALYADLIEILEDHGNVLTEHVGSETVETEEADLSDKEIHDQDRAWLRQADVVVAEVTTPSLGVGYEVGTAVEWGRPVLALYRPDGEHELSAMIRGSDGVTVENYSDPAALEDVFETFVERHR
jgi:nucleoside 2-deoxyribosyltransferase